MHAFPIAPSDTRPLWMLLPILLVILAAFAAVLLSLLGSRSSRFELSSEGLRLRGDWYGRLIPASQLRTTEARRVNFELEPDLRPRARTLGTALPGYRSGWFRLRNGEKALLYMTDQSRAVHVPTTEGYSVMVTPVDPEAFVKAMHSLGRRP